MTHRAQQIVDAAVAAIQAQANLPIDPANVYANRILTLADDQSEMDAITVDFGEDQPTGDGGSDNLAFIDSLLSLSITSIVIEDDEVQVKEKLFDMRRRIHQALMSDDTLGLSFVIGIHYAGASAPSLDGETGAMVGSLESKWNVLYRMNFADPGD